MIANNRAQHRDLDLAYKQVLRRRARQRRRSWLRVPPVVGEAWAWVRGLPGRLAAIRAPEVLP